MFTETLDITFLSIYVSGRGKLQAPFAFGIIQVLAVTLLMERLESFLFDVSKIIEFCDQTFTVWLNLLPKYRVDPFVSSYVTFQMVKIPVFKYLDVAT